MSGGHLFEASLILKLMTERKYNIQNVIIKQTSIYQMKKTEGTASKFLPYIHSSKLIEHFSQEKDFQVVLYSLTATLFSMFKPLEKCFNLIHKKTLIFKFDMRFER
jgi:hypothetical protein